MLYMGTATNVFWSYHTGDLKWDSFTRSLESFVMHCYPGAAVITIAHQAKTPNATQRKQAIQILSVTKGIEHVRAHAFASDSALNRASITAINWIWEKPFPERSFDAIKPALQWIGTQCPNADPYEVWQSIASKVPTDTLWRS